MAHPQDTGLHPWQDLLAGQKQVLEMIARDAPLADTLEKLVRVIEAQSAEMLGSVLLLSDDGQHMRHIAAPNLSKVYTDAVDGLPVGPTVGSCGTAAYRRERVVVEDIGADPLWRDYRHLAAAEGLRACWSTPILDAHQRVLGTFALYFREPKRPSDRDLQLIEVATHTAAIAIERAQLMRNVSDSESVFRSVFENAVVGMTLTDLQGRLIRCNPAFARMLGYAPEELAGRLFSELTHPDDVEANRRQYRALAAGEIGQFQLQKRYLRKDGGLVWVQLSVSRVPGSAGGAPFTVGMMEDVTERRLAEQKLRDSEQRFRSLVESSPDAILIHQDLRIVSVNQAMMALLGAREPGEIIGKPATSLLQDEFVTMARERIAALYAGKQQPRVEQIYRRLDGSTVPVEVAAAPLTLDGRPAVQVTVRDISDRKRSESRIEYLATHDDLTHLPNRTLVYDRIAQAISHARRAERQIAVLYLDVDRFKVINDGYGHGFGDALLKAAAERLVPLVREDDTVARQSGDEFLILLSDLRKSIDAYLVAQKILDAFSRPFAIEGREIHASASIGVSIFPQDGQTADALIGNADVAMYRAKELGRNGYQFFTRDMSEDTRRRVEIETELRSAVARGQLHLVYQPKVDLRSGQIIGCEALARWQHPTLGAVSPARFIPIAEDSGLIVPMGDWVLRTACLQARRWQEAGLRPHAVAVNISARQFLRQDLVSWVLAVLRETALAPQWLELELTESLLAQDVEKAIAAVDRLKTAGVRLAIDDFGTGYSSLSHLRRFRADTLKIDQSFIRNLESDGDDAAIALAVISLAHSLRMTAVAEGVETERQCRFLRRHKCDAIQGYFFSKPLPAQEMEALLRSGRTLHNSPGA